MNLNDGPADDEDIFYSFYDDLEDLRNNYSIEIAFKTALFTTSCNVDVANGGS